MPRETQHSADESNIEAVSFDISSHRISRESVGFDLSEFEPTPNLVATTYGSGEEIGVCCHILQTDCEGVGGVWDATHECCSGINRITCESSAGLATFHAGVTCASNPCKGFCSKGWPDCGSAVPDGVPHYIGSPGHCPSLFDDCDPCQAASNKDLCVDPNPYCNYPLDICSTKLIWHDDVDSCFGYIQYPDCLVVGDPLESCVGCVLFEQTDEADHCPCTAFDTCGDRLTITFEGVDDSAYARPCLNGSFPMGLTGSGTYTWTAASDGGISFYYCDFEFDGMVFDLIVFCDAETGGWSVGVDFDLFSAFGYNDLPLNTPICNTLPTGGTATITCGGEWGGCCIRAADCPGVVPPGTCWGCFDGTYFGGQSEAECGIIAESYGCTGGTPWLGDHVYCDACDVYTC